MSDRYVALGVARARSAWFSEVARWSTSGSLAMDFVKAVSVDEVRARLESGRAFSALLVDGALSGIDRDLVEVAVTHGCAVIVVSDTASRDWAGIGAATTLPSDFGPSELEAVLVDHATPIGRIDDLPGMPEVVADGAGFRARTVVVTGPGGTGASTVAMALAQGLADDVRHARTTVLADLALAADLAMLHDVRDVIPGILELTEAHRGGTPSPEDVRALTFDIVERRYHLLLGLRRHRDWTALRSRALRAALDGLRRSFTMVVADVTADFEGERATGSADVEDRNLLARTAIDIADVTVVVGQPGLKGAHSLLRVVRDCLEAGVAAERLVLVVDRAPRKRSARVELARTVIDLLAASHPDEELLSPVFVPERATLDGLLRDAARLPAAVVDPVTAAVLGRLDSLDERATPAAPEPVPVGVGSLGSWSDEEIA